MRIVRLTLSSPTGSISGKADAELICDALWVHSRPGDEIAHITTTPVPGGIDVAIFLNSGTDDPERLVDSLLNSISELPGTQVPPKTEEV
jgi:hypothetical protein